MNLAWSCHQPSIYIQCQQCCLWVPTKFVGGMTWLHKGIACAACTVDCTITIFLNIDPKCNQIVGNNIQHFHWKVWLLYTHTHTHICSPLSRSIQTQPWYKISALWKLEGLVWSPEKCKGKEFDARGIMMVFTSQDSGQWLLGEPGASQATPQGLWKAVRKSVLSSGCTSLAGCRVFSKYCAHLNSFISLNLAFPSVKWRW